MVDEESMRRFPRVRRGDEMAGDDMLVGGSGTVMSTSTSLPVLSASSASTLPG